MCEFVLMDGWMSVYVCHLVWHLPAEVHRNHTTALHSSHYRKLTAVNLIIMQKV